MSALAQPHTTISTEVESLTWLREQGVPVVPFAVASDAGAARSAARDLGFPVVMKMTGAVHKTDHGGVVTDVASPDEVVRAFERLAATMRGLDDGGHEGAGHVVIQPQLGGVEMLVGARRDPALGASVVVGFGGTLVEIFRDTAVSMAPLSPEEATELVDCLRGRPLLDGFRGSEAVDRRALESLLVLVSQVVAAETELSELDLNPVIVGPQGAVAVDARIVRTPSPPRRRRRQGPPPRELFEPRSVAVVGASNDPAKPGGRIMNHLRRHGYGGRLVPVNPAAAEVAGLPAVASLSKIDDGPVDLVCVAVPVAHVLDVLRECADEQVPAAIVFTAGYGEAGDEGRRHEESLRQVLLSHPTAPRVVGPNSIGVVSPGARVAASFAESLKLGDVPTGGLAFLSQSGALGSALLSRAWERGMGLSRWISSGNEVDLDIAHYLDFLADDDETDVIVVFLETIRDGTAFAAAARRCREAGKAVIAYKAGVSEVGRRAIASHTGALAGSDEIHDAFLRRHAVLRVRSLQTLLDVARVLPSVPLPRGDRLGVLTMSGGASSVIADEAAQHHLSIPVLDEATQRKLRRWVPAYGAVANPVDATADAAARPEILAGSLEILREHPDVDLAIVQLTTNADPSASAIAEAIIDARARSDKPILVGRLGAEGLAPDAMRRYREHGVEVFDGPERLVATAAAVCSYRRLVENARRCDPAPSSDRRP